MDLSRASRDELIQMLLAQRDLLVRLEQVVARQQEQIAPLQATVTHLTQHLGERAAPPEEPPPAAGASAALSPKRVPGTTPTTVPPRPQKPRTRRAQGFARRRLPPPARQVHAVAQCPPCGIALVGGSVKRTREVIEVPPVPVTVTEHGSLQRRCPGCQQRWTPPAELEGGVAGQQRLGVGLVSLIVTLREELRLPIAAIQWYLHTLHGLRLRVGGIVGALQRVAARGQGWVEHLRTTIRASPVVHVAETGWREAGQNGYAWTFSTAQARSCVRGSRERAVLEGVLGEPFAGVLVSAFYAAYTTYDGRHQDCWAHLLRDLHDLRVKHPTEPGVPGWAVAVHALYERATQVVSPNPAERRQAQQAYERELLALCQPSLVDPTAPQATLCRRMAEHVQELFVLVADPAVPADNNEAERSLRHLVTARKISGGTRSPVGSATKMTLASLFGTWRVQGLNPFDQCRLLLTAPQL